VQPACRPDPLGIRGDRVGWEPPTAIAIAAIASGRDRDRDRAPDAPVGARQSPSLNLAETCEPSQNGLFDDCPQRHSVTRLRTS
jgi:hypothetical protein